MRRKYKNDYGFTLIETLVVVTVISILLAVSAGMFTAIFNAHIRGNKIFAQQTSLQAASGFFSSRLSIADRAIGRRCDDVSSGSASSTNTRCLLSSGSSEGIDPLSIAGDQLVFVSDNSCYRVAYIERLKQIRVATADAADHTDASRRCDDVRVRPIRGPNEKNNSGDYITNTSTTDLRCDSMLDGVVCSGTPTEQYWFVLANSVTPTPPSSSAEGMLQMFTYKNAAGEVVSGIDSAANGSATDATQTATAHSLTMYGQPNTRNTIMSVDVRIYMEAPAGGPNVNTKTFKQNIYLGQINSGTGTSVPATPLARSLIMGMDSNLANNPVPPNTNNPILVKTDSADTTNLRSEEFPTQQVWLNVRGFLTVSTQSMISTPIIVTVRLQLYRNGVAVAAADGGRKEYIYQHNVSSSLTHEFTGVFEIPVGTDDVPTDKYSVGVLIANSSVLATINYSTNMNKMELDVWPTPRE